MSVSTTIYRFLLRLYPRAFRQEFGCEMEEVFQEQLVETSDQGRLLLALWRELRDWPASCFRAHWYYRRQRLLTARGTAVGWKEAAAAGIPFFILAVFLSASTVYVFVNQNSSSLVSLMFSYGLLFILILLVVYAWRRGWPAWSASWIGMLLFVLLVLLLPSRLLDGLILDPQMQLVRLLISEVGLQLLWLAAIYLLLLRWPRIGMVAMLPAVGIAWLLYLEFVPEIVSTVVMASTWILLGLAAAVLLRWKRRTWDIWLLYVTAFAVGALYIFAGHFLTEMQVREQSLPAMLTDLFSEFVPTLIPLVAILLLHTLRLWSKPNGQLTVISSRIISAALVLAVVGFQAMLLVFRQDAQSPFQANLEITVTIMLAAGCLLLLTGIGLMVFSRTQWKFNIGLSPWFLLALLVVLPLVFNTRWISTAYYQIASNRLGPDGSTLQVPAAAVSIIDVASRTAGLIWLLFAGLIFSRIHSRLDAVSSTSDSEVDEGALAQVVRGS